MKEKQLFLLVSRSLGYTDKDRSVLTDAFNCSSYPDTLWRTVYKHKQNKTNKMRSLFQLLIWHHLYLTGDVGGKFIGDDGFDELLVS